MPAEGRVIDDDRARDIGYKRYDGGRREAQDEADNAREKPGIFSIDDIQRSVAAGKSGTAAEYADLPAK